MPSLNMVGYISSVSTSIITLATTPSSRVTSLQVILDHIVKICIWIMDIVCLLKQKITYHWVFLWYLWLCILSVFDTIDKSKCFPHVLLQYDWHNYSCKQSQIHNQHKWRWSHSESLLHECWLLFPILQMTNKNKSFIHDLNKNKSFIHDLWFLLICM